MEGDVYNDHERFTGNGSGIYWLLRIIKTSRQEAMMNAYRVVLTCNHKNPL